MQYPANSCPDVVSHLFRALLLCLLACLFPIAATAQSLGTVFGVYPGQMNDGGVTLYAVVRGIPDSPPAVGTGLTVGITAAAREQAGDAPCANCTAAHYFVLPEPSGTRPKLLIHAPGPVTYLIANDKEYMLTSIRLAWTDDGPRLERATLMQTGFIPRLFKHKIRIHFDIPLEPGTRAEEIAGMALADMMESERIAQAAYENAVNVHR